jgi:hypothetical protein
MWAERSVVSVRTSWRAALPLLARRRNFASANVSGVSSLLCIAQDRLAWR